MLFDRHLTWDAHVSDVVRKCVGLLIGLRHLRHFLPQHVMLTIVQGLITSRVRYCISVHGNGSAANDTGLLKVVNFATRVVTGLKKYEHVSSARVDLGLCTPRQMCDMRTTIVAHKAYVMGEPAELASLFCTYAAARTCERATRQDRHLRPPARRTAAGQRSFAYHATSLLNLNLNALLDDMGELELAAFKRAVRRLYLHDTTC